MTASADSSCRGGSGCLNELKLAVCEQCQAFEATVVLIEDKASGTQLILELIADGLHAVTRYQPQADKNMRMHAQTG